MVLTDWPVLNRRSLWTGISVSVAAACLLKLGQDFARKSRLRAAVEKKQKARQEQFETLTEQRKSDDEGIRRKILNFSVEELIDALQKEEVSAVDALHAFQWRSLEAQAKTNCVTEFLMEAEEWATNLDERYSGLDPKPPLFGVPFSVKESFMVKGHDLTRGYAQDLYNPSTEDAVIIASLKELGAIPFVLTNVPQSLLSFTCSNPIYGKTTNPYDPERTSGGSSGGEAALLALGGAPFGLGGDVGGSIRIPAHFCGVVGLKPSHTRVSQYGARGSVPGRPFLCAAGGPMARDVGTVVTVMRHLLSSSMADRDPYSAPIPFRENLFTGDKKLRIGFFDDDGWFEPTSSCRRAVLEAKTALRDAGHTLLPFQPPNMSGVVGMFLATAVVDGGKYLMNRLNKDLKEPLNGPLMKMYSIPQSLRLLLGVLVRPFWPRTGLTLTCLPRNTSELREVYEKVGDYRNEFMKKWKEEELDCLICPALASPALPHTYPMKMVSMVGGTAIYNLLDFCAGVVPFTKVTREDERETAESYKIQDFMSRLVRRANSSGSVDLPVGVQCVAPPFREEICLKLMKEVEHSVKPKF